MDEKSGRRWQLVVVIAVLVSIAGCTSTPTGGRSANGVVTGTAQACAGPGFVAIAHLAVYRGNATVARDEVDRKVTAVAKKQVPTDSTYRFDLPAGRYFITNTGDTEIAHPFVLSARGTVRLDIPNLCR